MFGKAFSPSGISSFFEVCTQDENGSPLSDLVKMGARGGGFALTKGVTTSVIAHQSPRDTIMISINGKEQEALTTQTLINLLLEHAEHSYAISVDHQIEVPIGTGFGTSAAGALSCGLALVKALNLPLSYNSVARLAHIADIQCSTGLGTVEGLLVGGLVLITQSGAIGHGLVDRILIPSNLKIVVGVYEGISKAPLLSSYSMINVINQTAKHVMTQIINNPTLSTFLMQCRNFAITTGLASKRVRTLMDKAESAGAIGAAQNMLGEAVHAITTPETLDEVVNALAEDIPPDNLIVSDIAFHGAHLIS
jgi:pantoate kinase